MCNACFGDDKIKTTTTFTVEYNGSIIVVRNVFVWNVKNAAKSLLLMM